MPHMCIPLGTWVEVRFPGRDYPSGLLEGELVHRPRGAGDCYCVKTSQTHLREFMVFEEMRPSPYQPGYEWYKGEV